MGLCDYGQQLLDKREITVDSRLEELRATFKSQLLLTLQNCGY